MPWRARPSSARVNGSRQRPVF